MSVINKLDLNIQIVKMRHTSRQAKVHVIHKLVKKVRELTKKAEKRDESTKAKLEVKANKFREEILIMKSLKVDEISAFALINTADLNQTLADTNSGPKVRALARLSLHNRLLAAVKMFQNKYPDWKETFPAALLALKKRKPLKLPKSKRPVDKVEERENNPEDNSENSESEEGLNDNSCEESENSSPEDLEISNEKGSDEFFCRISEQDSDSSMPDAKVLNPKSAQKNVKSTAKVPKKKADKSVKSDKSSTIKKAGYESVSLGENISDEKRFVDPFFLKKDDTEYLSLAPVELKTENDNTESRRERLFDSLPSSSFKDKGTFWKSSKGRMAPFDAYSDRNKRHKNDSASNRKFPRRKESASELDASNEELHPSWAAKKKSSVLVPFQGKKVVFD